MEMGELPRLQRPPFIGREETLNAIKEAFATTQTGASCVVYLEGPGGIGKTRILSQVHDLLVEPPLVISTDVIDLYHARYHQRPLLMHTIAQRLRRSLQEAGVAGEFFARFEQTYEQFSNRRGSTSITNQSKLQELRTAFLNDYAEVTQGRSVVLLLDTFEKLRVAIPYPHDFDFRQSSHLETWLRDLIADLPNTLTLVAGRPRKGHAEMLTEKFTGHYFRRLTIEPFTKDEARQYIEQLDDDIDKEQDDLTQTLYVLTGGDPILLSIGLSLALVTGPEALPATREELKQQQFVERIVNLLRNVNVHFSQLLEIMMLLRKGVHTRLLRFVLQADRSIAPDIAELEQAFEVLKSLLISKVTVDPHVPPEERVVTLHDEVYELLHDTLGRGREKEDRFKRTIDYLDQQIAEKEQQSHQRSHLSDRDAHIQTLQVERLFYKMALNPVQGYQDYRELCFSAIQANDEDFDTQLRYEFARFYEANHSGTPVTKWSQDYHTLMQDFGFSWERYRLHEGIHWIYRRIKDGDDYRRYDLAVELVDQVQATCQDVLSNGTLEAALDQYSLEVARLQAQIFIHDPDDPQGEKISERYEEVVGEIEATRRVLASSVHGTPKHMRAVDVHHSQLVLAIAYSDWGYFERTKQRLEQAIEYYKQAIRLFKQLGPEVKELHAMALNNMGFAQSLQGNSDRGMRAVEEALRMRQELGIKYSVALSLNTLARLYIRLDRPLIALECVQEANSLLSEDETSVRGRALCALAEGLVQRKLAVRQGGLPSKIEKLELAESAYLRAADVFDNLRENERRIEAYLGLGKTHREWAEALKAAEQSATIQEHLERAQHYLEQAATLSADGPVKTPERVDILVNQASILREQEVLEQAMQQLDEARNGVPRSYWRFDRPQTAPTTGTLQNVRLYLLRMGQIEFQRGMCLFQQEKHQEAVECFTRTFAYLIEFFPEPRVQIRTYRAIVVRELRTLQSKQLLEHFRGHAKKYVQSASKPLPFAAETEAAITKLFDDVLEDIELF